MITYTLHVTETTVIVHDGRLPESRLKYHADGMQVFVKGACPMRKRDSVNYHALELFLAHHFPLRNVVSEGWV